MQRRRAMASGRARLHSLTGQQRRPGARFGGSPSPLPSLSDGGASASLQYNDMPLLAMFGRLRELNVDEAKLEKLMHRADAIELLQAHTPTPARNASPTKPAGDMEMRQLLSSKPELRGGLDVKAEDGATTPGADDRQSKKKGDEKAVMGGGGILSGESFNERVGGDTLASLPPPGPKKMAKAGGARRRKLGVAFSGTDALDSKSPGSRSPKSNRSPERRGSVMLGAGMKPGQSGTAIYPAVETLWADQHQRYRWLIKFADCGLFTSQQLKNAIKASSDGKNKEPTIRYMKVQFCLIVSM